MHKKLLLGVCSAAFVLGAMGSQAGAKNVNIKLSYWVPPTHLLTPGYKDWGAAVEKASGGTVTTTLYPTSQLGSGRDHYDMVKRGIAGFGLINPGYTPGRFPILGASDLPFMISDSGPAARALTRWYKKYAAKEMPEHYVCHVFTHEPGSFHTTKKEIRVPADIKGLNIRSANQTISRYVTAMGGNPVQVPIMEAKDTLEKGITDGISVPLGAVSMKSTFSFGTVVKYTLDSPLYVSTFTHGINKKLYDGMDAKQRKAIDDHCTPEWALKTYKYWYEDDKADLEDARANLKGHTWTKIGPKEVALWREAAQPVVKLWRESVEKVGGNPDQILNEMKAELKKENVLF